MSATRAAIIVAAGASQRMGTPKALLPWADTTLLGYALREARLAGVTQTVVVLGPATAELASTLADVRTVINPEPQTGRSTSIRLGADELSQNVAAILIQSVDQPAPSDVLEALFAALDGPAAVSVPTHAGRRGHPVCFAGRILPELCL
ncbi:MAG TPA: nucleotidyltransferase family protein, partial [Chloroflexota bacterium]|nr:nucleotidyltransferase family protein [Chloroflexota bacterium]